MKEQGKIEKIGKELKVKIANNSWGDVAVLKHGADWHAILQPEDIESVAGLKVGESCEIKDEQGYTWTVTNNGDGFNIQSKFSNYKGYFQLDTKYLLSIAKWTEPEHLSKQDHIDLKEVNRLYREKKFKEAFHYASDLDTIVREEIPGAIWKEIGGELTKTGEDKLKKKLSKKSQRDSDRFDEREDDLNPKFMFSLTRSQLLSEALKGEFDINYLVRMELANRGQDENGKWVGFDKAKAIHKI